MFARKDWKGLNDLYWQTAVWMAVISFPIFALTFAQAHPLMNLLYGHRYVNSAPILAVLSLGYYANAVMGSNGTTLLVFGKIRFVVLTNLIMVLLNVALAFALVPRYGALGAAIAIGVTLVVTNVIRQVGLSRCRGMQFFSRKYTNVYVSIAFFAEILYIESVLSHNVAIGIVVSVVASIFVLMLNRHSLNVGHTFPELMRFAIVRRLVEPSKRRGT